MKQLLVVAALVLTAGCTKNYYSPAAPTPPDDTPPPPPVVHTLEFRVESVLGFDTQQAAITYGSNVDGTNAVRSALPWFVSTTSPSLTNQFVFLQAVAEGENQVRVQILVDGRVFREATGFSPSVSGTVR